MAPTPIERQLVSNCLGVFSEKIHHTLLTLSGISEDKNNAAIFINKVLTRWKILNVKTLQIDGSQWPSTRGNQISK